MPCRPTLDSKQSQPLSPAGVLLQPPGLHVSVGWAGDELLDCVVCLVESSDELLC